MDRQAWIAVALCILGLIGWQVYMVRHPAPPPPKIAALPSATATAATTTSPAASAAPLADNRASSPNESSSTPAPRAFVEKTTPLRNSDLELLLTNRGGGIA